jgi:hypothetical protein
MHHAPSENVGCPFCEALCFAYSLAVVESLMIFSNKKVSPMQRLGGIRLPSPPKTSGDTLGLKPEEKSPTAERSVHTTIGVVRKFVRMPYIFGNFVVQFPDR